MAGVFGPLFTGGCIEKNLQRTTGLKMDYIQRLEEAMHQTETYKPEYIAKCLQYAQKLLVSELPVLFDRKHVNMV